MKYLKAFCQDYIKEINLNNNKIFKLVDDEFNEITTEDINPLLAVGGAATAGAAAAGASAVYGAYKILSNLVNWIRTRKDACRKLTGTDLQNCRVNVAKAAVARLSSAKSKCKGDARCESRFQKMIDKWNVQLANYQKSLQLNKQKP